MDNRLLALLVCPICKGPLKYDRENNELISVAEGLAFPIRDGIPVLLESEARSLDAPGGAAGGHGDFGAATRLAASPDAGGIGRSAGVAAGPDASNDPA